MQAKDRAKFLAFIEPLSLQLEEYALDTQLTEMFSDIYKTKRIMKFTPDGK